MGGNFLKTLEQKAKLMYFILYHSILIDRRNNFEKMCFSDFLYFNMDFKWYNDNFERLAPVSLLYFRSASNPNEVTRKIRQYYFGNKEISLADWVNITNVI